MATSGVDAKLKIWDLRTFKSLNEYRTPTTGAATLAFSQKKLLAASYRDVVEIYKDLVETDALAEELPRYLLHQCPNGSSVKSVAFCPFEDVLGVGHDRGFTSLLIPGAGEANFDALEANPYQTKKQRKQAEVKQLLDKVSKALLLTDRITAIVFSIQIQPEMITLDNTVLTEIDRDAFARKQEEKRQKFNFVKAKDLIPKSTKKGKIGKRLTRKKQMHDAKLKEIIQEQMKQKKRQS